MKKEAVFIMVLICGVVVSGLALAQPTVNGIPVETYAQGLDIPEKLTFGDNGDLFVGHGPQIPAEIYRIPAGGGTILAYGNEALLDADAVLYDRHGYIADPGSVLTERGVITSPYIAANLPAGVLLELPMEMAT